MDRKCCGTPNEAYHRDDCVSRIRDDFEYTLTRRALRQIKAEAWQQGWDARAHYIGTTGDHYRGNNPFRPERGAE